MKNSVKIYVQQCEVCQITKGEHVAKLGLLHPIAIPTQAWEVITMNFIEGLPTFMKYNCALVIIDKYTKYASLFWKELMKQAGTSTHYSTTYHPETDGHSERLNQCLEQYLRSMCFLKSNAWTKYLPQAEWWYNTNYRKAIEITPFEALYGYKPPSLA
ncbi:hypothetical protein HRI_002005500 [Hibiscus trionum]|uniref:Integrase catalytic domain-containing protein n=1 Tax=Hibiscus trionum TaxID=183268 RepID=A0A9W7HTV6_HIBTR|nr:hypothetical protein HRI_002005500 [Hibiscus trionum]